MSPGYQLGWLLVRALLQVADASLCPHRVKRARELGGVCLIRMLIPFRGLHPVNHKFTLGMVLAGLSS